MYGALGNNKQAQSGMLPLQKNSETFDARRRLSIGSESEKNISAYDRYLLKKHNIRSNTVLGRGSEKEIKKPKNFEHWI